LLLDAENLALVEDGRHVSQVSMASGKTTWTYQPRAPTSLTGEPPRLFGGGDVLCLLLPLNFGYQLERIDPATGKHLWPDAPRLARTAFDGTAVAFDTRTLYYAVDQVLHARSVTEGKKLWSQPLPAPAGAWKVVSLGPAVAVYPLPSLPLLWDRASRVPCLVPLGFSQVALPVPSAPRSPYNAPGFCVQLHDPRDGQLIQRLNFATIHQWAVLQRFGRQLAVAANSKAWGLAGVRE